MYDISYLVIDDFYRDPDAVRAHALQLPYQEAQNEQDWKFYKGRLSTTATPYIQLGLETISAALKNGIVLRQPCGEFRLLYAPTQEEPGGRTWVHTDCSVGSYTGLVFLNPPEQCRGGLNFYKHKRLNIDRLPRDGSPEAAEISRRLGLDVGGLAQQLADEGYDLEGNWETSDTIGMKFNRCIIFDARIFHARSERFGLHRHEARMTQNFFFDLSPRPLAPYERYRVEHGAPLRAAG